MERYEITAIGELDPSWSKWFEGMEITVKQNLTGKAVTVLNGGVEDQARLRGILCRLWDLNLALAAVRRVEQESSIRNWRKEPMNVHTSKGNGGKAVLEAQGLTKSYGRVQALRGVDLQVERGEIFGFLGPNGAGKTTTIRCMLDMIRPDSGRLRVLGIHPQANPTEVQKRTGYLPGEMALFPNLTAERQLRFFNDMRGREGDWMLARELSERLGLDLKQRIKNLSKGNKQKIGVVQALMHRPELVLLDEPTAGLDPLVQQEVLAIIREVRAGGATVFFSSHILSEVEALSDRVAILRQGQIVEIGDTSSLTERAVHRVVVRFLAPVECRTLHNIPGVEVTAEGDDLSLTLRVVGPMDALVKALGGYPVSELETSRPSLEEVFLEYYRKENN
jgi:ABC-2 type transport system ATP-binding protein